MTLEKDPVFRRINAFIEIEEVVDRIAGQPYDPYRRFAGRALKKLLNVSQQTMPARPEPGVDLDSKRKTLIINRPTADEIAEFRKIREETGGVENFVIDGLDFKTGSAKRLEIHFTNEYWSKLR